MIKNKSLCLKKSILLFSLVISSFAFAAEPLSYIVYDYQNNQILEQKNPHHVLPIASVTKLMTAYVFLKHNNDPLCFNSITEEDTDRIKGTRTRIPKNESIMCYQLLHAMLISSDNYAASSLARSVPNVSKNKFISMMNDTARELGMTNTHFFDSSGLDKRNVSTVSDLVKLSKYAMNMTDIRQISSRNNFMMNLMGERGFHNVAFNNTNRLIREGIPAIISKTGYIKESGYNLLFVSKNKCENGRVIGVISLNNSSSENRAVFTRSKLSQYGCLEQRQNYGYQYAKNNVNNNSNYTYTKTAYSKSNNNSNYHKANYKYNDINEIIADRSYDSGLRLTKNR